MPSDTSPSVSVAITSFNSEPWLARAVHSALAQQTAFPVEIVIADDLSTDSTLRLAQALARDHPSVRVLPRSARLGMQHNYFDLWEQCRGRFIAWLDADDTWTDPAKLTLQVEALTADPTLAACAHFVRFLTPTGEVTVPRYPERPAGRYTLRDLILGNFVPSPSILFRAGLHRRLPPWFFTLSGCCDWPMLLLAASEGDILLLDRIMADYQCTPTGSYSSRDFHARASIDLEVRAGMAATLPTAWQRQVRIGVGRQYQTLAYECRHNSLFAESRRAALKAFTAPALFDDLPAKTRALAAALLAEPLSRMRRHAPDRHSGFPKNG